MYQNCTHKTTTKTQNYLLFLLVQILPTQNQNEVVKSSLYNHLLHFLGNLSISLKSLCFLFVHTWVTIIPQIAT